MSSNKMIDRLAEAVRSVLSDLQSGVDFSKALDWQFSRGVLPRSRHAELVKAVKASINFIRTSRMRSPMHDALARLNFLEDMK